MRNSNHCYVQHRFVLANNRLNIGREYIQATGNDHVLLAIQDIQIPIFIELADIARTHIAATRRVMPDNGIRCVGPVMIFLHHARAGTGNFPDFIRAEFISVIIYNSDIETEDRRADGGGLCTLLMRPVHGPETFRIAV